MASAPPVRDRIEAIPGLALERSPTRVALTLLLKCAWLPIWLVQGVEGRGRIETLLLAALTARALQSLWRFFKPLRPRAPLLVIGVAGLQDPERFRFPIPWTRVEACAYRGGVWTKTLRVYRDADHVDIDLTLASSAQAERAFRACVAAISAARARAQQERLAPMIRPFPAPAPFAIQPLAVSLAFGLAGGVVVAGCFGPLTGL